ncbi:MULTISPECIES: hypothetical protein [unclassified Sulfitobacter]|jgi:hypothetical protein|uniref:hypothetical protein n=1 Tax=unclassified Sulfitobacter TaxID=196795 RepID=UPI000A605ADD|nr:MULTISPECIES: hypothetical protein [unclassified Sulfitobacter]
MLESITSEELTSFGLIGTSVLVIVGSLLAIIPKRKKRPDIDVDAAVRNAPYHLLDKL